MSSHKTLNVHLPEWLYREIEEEARQQKSTKGAVARQRLSQKSAPKTEALIGDLFGIADDLPEDLSEGKDLGSYGHDGCR
jgi:hypothetical protein